jgi:hypothetical protein
VSSSTIIIIFLLTTCSRDGLYVQISPIPLDANSPTDLWWY